MYFILLFFFTKLLFSKSAPMLKNPTLAASRQGATVGSLLSVGMPVAAVVLAADEVALAVVVPVAVALALAARAGLAAEGPVSAGAGAAHRGGGGGGDVHRAAVGRLVGGWVEITAVVFATHQAGLTVGVTVAVALAQAAGGARAAETPVTRRPRAGAGTALGVAAPCLRAVSATVPAAVCRHGIVAAPAPAPAPPATARTAGRPGAPASPAAVHWKAEPCRQIYFPTTTHLALRRD